MLTPDVMKQVRRLQIRARRTVQALLGGEYRSAFKGTGLTFEDVREYQPGDDIRSIDWNVTARMGHPYIKRYSEERELTILLVVDLSRSQSFGTQNMTKRMVVAELAAVIAMAAAANNDRVGLIGFTDHVEQYVPPGKGSRHTLRVLRDILYFQPQGTRTHLEQALHFVNKVQRKRAVVLLISDFLDSGFADPFQRAARKHDLIAVRTSDPLEQSWPAMGLVQLEDAETGEQVLIDSDNSQFTQQFSQRTRELRDRFTQLARSTQVDFIDVSTNGKHFEELLKFFRVRDRHRRSG